MNLEILGNKEQTAPLLGYINVHRRGRIRLSRALVSGLSLKTGQRVILANDRDSKKDWYITFSGDEGEGYKLNSLSKQVSTILVAEYNTDVVRTLLTAIKADISATLLIAMNHPIQNNGKNWYRILTSNPKRVK